MCVEVAVIEVGIGLVVAVEGGLNWALEVV